MPEDPTPDGQGILNKSVVKPFPDLSPENGKEDAVRSLVSPDMEEPAGTNRPPLGN
jgi:hypothetical protein